MDNWTVQILVPAALGMPDLKQIPMIFDHWQDLTCTQSKATIGGDPSLSPSYIIVGFSHFIVGPHKMCGWGETCGCKWQCPGAFNNFSIGTCHTIRSSGSSTIHDPTLREAKNPVHRWGPTQVNTPTMPPRSPPLACIIMTFPFSLLSFFLTIESIALQFL